LTGAGARILVAAAFTLCAGSLTAQQSKEKEAELRELRGRIDRLKKELDAAESSRAQAADQLRESETAISDANRRLRELAADRNRTQAELARIAAETQALREDLDARQRQLARLAQARYTEGERGFLRVLLSGEDPHRVARALVYQSYLSRAQAQMIEQARDDLARLAALAGSAREKQAVLTEIESKSRTERDALRARAAERRQVLARASGQIQRNRKDLATAQQNEARLARLVQELARAARQAPPSRARPGDAPAVGAFGRLKGQLRVPVRGDLGNAASRASQAASPSPKGIFIRAAEGADVHAIAAGRVVFAEWMRGYGNLLILDHGDGYLSIYGNNESVLKRVGDAVHAGDTVATVGASGGNDTSGLYFELRHQGRAFDPIPWLKPR
jgi:septal ring factor EnvC (AmiA/AmiB activator)